MCTNQNLYCEKVLKNSTFRFSFQKFNLTNFILYTLIMKELSLLGIEQHSHIGLFKIDVVKYLSTLNINYGGIGTISLILGGFG